MKILVKVTQEHIDKGCRSRANSCPIALAVNEALAKKGFNNYHCSVWRNVEVYRIEEVTADIYELPDRIFRKLFDYDSLKGMKPFQFMATFNNLEV